MKELTREFTIVINMDECREHMERRRKIIEQVKEQIRLAFGEHIDVSFVDAAVAEEISIGYRMRQLEELEALTSGGRLTRDDFPDWTTERVLPKPVEPWREKRRKPWRKRR